VYCPSGTALPLDCPTGATCTIPASPELIVEYDAALERRESEVTVVVDSFLVGTISYNLSLSVYPLSVVEVTVTKEVEAGADCVEYNDGLSIKRNASFFFDAINWNISQTVHIDIRRDAGVFQGSSTMLFSHSVRSNDPVWKSPFLRPMRLSIIDDDDCVKGAQKFDEIIGGCRIRKCGCAEDFFIEETDSFYCNSVTKCEPCPEGMKCTFQQKLEQAQISNGWYRPNNVSLSVVECPLPHVCVGENTSGDDLCREGHKGPLCLVCRQAHVWTSSEECVLCDSELKISLYLGLGASLLVLAAISANILRRKQIAGRAGRFSTWESFVDKATTKYKIIINFFQILSKMAELHPFRLPTSFLSFFSVFNVFSLDLQLLPFNCLFESDFHSILLATTLLPLVFVLFVYALFILQRLRIQRLSGDVDASRVRHEIDNVQSKCEFTVTLVLISACPIITTTIFQTFVYDARLGNGLEYLRADYGIERSDPTHQKYVVYSGVMAVLYCVALPAFALRVLNSRKLNIRKLQSAEKISVKAQHSLGSVAAIKDADPLLGGLSPLYKDFCAEFWWFQIVLWFCNTFQTGIVTLIPAESTSQVTLSLLTSIVMLVLLANACPYMNWSDDALAQSCQFTLALVQIVGLLQMNKSVAQDDWLYGPVLIFCTIFSGGLGIALVLIELFQAVAPESFEKIASKVRFTDRGKSLRKSPMNTFNSASVLPVDLNDKFPDVNTDSGAQTEMAVEAPSPSIRVRGSPALNEQLTSSSTLSAFAAVLENDTAPMETALQASSQIPAKCAGPLEAPRLPVATGPNASTAFKGANRKPEKQPSVKKLEDISDHDERVFSTWGRLSN
jgi:hypothetical protein